MADSVLREKAKQFAKDMVFLPYRKLRISYKVKNKFDFIAMREFPREARKTHMALQSVFSSVYLNCNYR